jgi:rhamnogalacturonyl hydrolase YesR
MFITENDFNMLSNTQMQWSGYDWEIQADRFTADISFEFQWAFWFDSLPALIMARTFLMQREIKFQETYDDALEQFVILTDYTVDELAVA